MHALPPGIRFVDEHPFGAELKARRFELDNGLRVLFLADHSAPIFSMHTWFRVGSRNEREGVTGIAHLFEHLMFKATSNNPEGTFDRMMEARGAQTNAATWCDWTFYKETLGKEDLDLALGLESDRMVNLVLNQQQLDAERGVVENERRMAVDNSLMGTMSEKLSARLFTHHPYRWPTIGWMRDIQAISLEDCLGFYRTYYAPNNAVLTVVGDLDEATTLEKIQKYYGRIERQTIPEYRPPDEPPLEAEIREELEWPTPTHKLLVGYRGPGYMDPDGAALSLFAVLLCNGRSSRLFKRLVMDDQLANDIEAFLTPFIEKGIFEISVTLNEGKDPAEVERILDEELEKALAEGITEAELEKAKNLTEADFYKQLRTAEDRAYALGFHEIVSGDYRELMNRVAVHAAVTREHVNEAARRYLSGKKRVVLLASPNGDVEEEEDEEGEEVLESAAPPSPEFDREILPGLRMIGETRRDIPVAVINAYVMSGGFCDPAGKEGLAYLAGETMLAGAAGMGRDELTEKIEALGATLSVHVDHECTIIAGQVLSRNLEPFVELMGQVLTRPTFEQIEIDKQKKLQVTDILNTRDSDSSLVRRFFRQQLFGEHLLGRPLLGWMGTVSSITREEVLGFYERHYRVGNMVLAAAGDVEADTLQRLLTPALAPMAQGSSLRMGEPPGADRTGRRLLLVDKPDRTQNHFAIGHTTISARDPDYFPLLVGCTAFGGIFTSRLNEELRVKRGWTYGVYSLLPRTRLGDAFYIYTYTATKDTAPALQLTLEMYDQFVEKGLTQTELDASKEYLVHQYPFTVDTAEKRVGLRLETLIKSLPENFHRDFQQHIRSQTLDQVNEAIRRRFQTKNLAITMVCTAADLEKELGQLTGFEPIQKIDWEIEGTLAAERTEKDPA